MKFFLPIQNDQLVKYSMSFIIIFIFSKLFFSKYLKKLYKRLLNKQSKLKLLLESNKTTTRELCKKLYLK